MKKLRKRTLEFTSLGMLTSLGSAAVTQAGGSTAGLATMSSFYPLMGTIEGSAAVMRSMKRLSPKRKRRR